jgi:hypothetical protein
MNFVSTRLKVDMIIIFLQKTVLVEVCQSDIGYKIKLLAVGRLTIYALS